ncbi:MAG: hypothetical protein ACE369_12080 [Roseovarius sp.]
MASAADMTTGGTRLTGTALAIEAAGHDARRAILSFGGAALCMAGAGLWLIPSDDAAMQLIKLLASVTLVLGGMILFNGLNSGDTVPEVQIDTVRRQLRVYEYDARGRSTLKSCHDIDDLQELSVRHSKLRARDRAGVLLLEFPLGAEDDFGAIRGLMPRAS